MKTILYFLITALTLSFVACQKDADSDRINPSGIGPRIKTENVEGDIAVYTYDERGRIIHELYADSSSDLVQYYKGYYIEKEYDAQGNLTNQRHFELNADSLVETLTTTAQPDHETKYEYDAQKRVILATSTSPGTLFIAQYYYGSEGNQDSVVFSQNGVWLYTWENTFLAHQPNVYTKKVYGRIYNGEESKNLLAGSYCRFPNPLNNAIYQYDYTFDNQGRIITMNQRFNGISEQFEYTYQ